VARPGMRYFFDPVSPLDEDDFDDESDDDFLSEDFVSVDVDSAGFDSDSFFVSGDATFDFEPRLSVE